VVNVGVMNEKAAANSKQPAVSLKRAQFDRELLLTAYIKSSHIQAIGCCQIDDFKPK